MRYHLGTVAIASLIIAVIEFIRWTVRFIEAKTKGKDGQQNRLQKCVFCMIYCCLRCLECCMDKINKNALIWVCTLAFVYLCTLAFMCSSICAGVVQLYVSVHVDGDLR